MMAIYGELVSKTPHKDKKRLVKLIKIGFFGRFSACKGEKYTRTWCREIAKSEKFGIANFEKLMCVVVDFVFEATSNACGLDHGDLFKNNCLSLDYTLNTAERLFIQSCLPLNSIQSKLKLKNKIR